MENSYGYVISLRERDDRKLLFAENAFKENLQFEFVDAIRGNSDIVSKQFACSSSHLKAISSFMNSDRQWAIIFEDDADICPNFVDVAREKMEDTIDAGGSFCYLGGFGFAADEFHSKTWAPWKGKGKKLKDNLYQAVIVDGAHCYAINRTAASSIIKVVSSYLGVFQTCGFVPVIPPLNMMNPGVDNLLNDMVVRGILNATVSFPVLSNQRPGFSNIDEVELSRPTIERVE